MDVHGTRLARTLFTIASMRKLWFPVLLGLLLTAVLFPLGIVFSKDGGEAFSLIFPYTALLSVALPTRSSTFAVILGYSLFFLQYPVYGIILNMALDRGKFYQGLLSLLSLHVIVAVSCFATLRH